MAYEQIDRHDPGVGHKREMKKRAVRSMRRSGKKHLDKAPKKYRFRGYTL